MVIKGDIMVNLGLIGLGSQGLEHLEASAFSKKAKITMVCDSNPNTLIKVKEARPDILTFSSIEEMLPNKGALNGLVLSLPHHQYGPIWAAIESFHLPVLKEKPLGRNLAEAMQFFSIFSKPGVFLKTAIQRRYHPSYSFLANRIKSGGEPSRIMEVMATLHLGKKDNHSGWRGDPIKSGGGALLDCGYHLVDLVTSFTGQMELISANLWCDGKPATNQMIEDQATLYAKAGNCWIFIEIRKDGEMKNGNIQKKEEIYLRTTDGEYKADRTGVWLDGKRLMNCDKGWIDTMPKQLDEFADDIENKRVDYFAIWEQTPVMRVIESAYALARESFPTGVVNNG